MTIRIEGKVVQAILKDGEMVGFYHRELTSREIRFYSCSKSTVEQIESYFNEDTDERIKTPTTEGGDSKKV